jgi:cold shock CspA family protein
MRYQGKLKKWNAERGFGFIEVNGGGQEIFVHISAFLRDGVVPFEGEALRFEIEPDRDGKKRAVRVRRPTTQPGRLTSPSPLASRRVSRTPKKSGFGSVVISLLLVAALGFYGYNLYAKRVARAQAAEVMPDAAPPVVSLFEPVTPPPAPAPVAKPANAATQPSTAATSNFRCDGRKYCSQMTSCKEAKYFLQNCPGVKMDGNHDGVPCEQQWCTSPIAD